MKYFCNPPCCCNFIDKMGELNFLTQRIATTRNQMYEKQLPKLNHLLVCFIKRLIWNVQLWIKIRHFLLAGAVAAAAAADD